VLAIGDDVACGLCEDAVVKLVRRRRQVAVRTTFSQWRASQAVESGGRKAEAGTSLVKDVCRASYGVNICWRQRRRSPIDWLRRRLCPVVCYFCEKIATFSTAWRSRKRRHANRKRLDHRAPDDSRGQQPMGAALRDARSLRSTASFAARKWTLLSCGIDCPSQGPPGSPNSTHTQATRPPCLDLSASASPPPPPPTTSTPPPSPPRLRAAARLGGFAGANQTGRGGGERGGVVGAGGGGGGGRRMR